MEIIHELTRVGRGKQCEFAVESRTMSREHSLVIRRSSGFWLCDLQSTYGTWVSRGGGPPARVGNAVELLSDGDVFDLRDHVRFTSGEPDPVEQALAAAVSARPEDEACWQVYRDHLITIGDLRGDRIATASTALFWPGSALDSRHLELSLVWAFGHVREATLRELDHGGDDLLRCLRALLWAPAAEFMTSLVLELLPDTQLSVPGTLANRIIETTRVLLETSRLPALRRLRVPEILGVPGIPHSAWLRRGA